MFINIDHEKRPSDYKLHLAKPNKEIISVLHEKQNSTLNLKLGNISELNFSIPYFVEDSNLQMIKNPNIERIRELMYVKLTWGEFEEWFLIDNITESSENNEIMNVQSFSIGYENKRKKINEFKETAINATEFYTEILKDSPWSIGEIDGSFDLLYRSFDESGTDRFELIKTGAETFGGVIVWDTNNKKINLKEPDNIGEFRGLTVSYDRLMSSLNKTRTTDEMVTRLYVYGNERITIENKNPTNEKYIEDYSYFMHPFKRDTNKNVLESSYYMSDSLCHALLDNKELRDKYEPQIKTIQRNIENKNASLSLAMIELNDAEFTLMSAKGLLDIAKAVDDKALIAQRKTEVSNATSIVNTKKTAVNNLTSQIEVLQNQVSVLQNAISVRSFTKELINELEPYIIEKEIEDARYIDEDELYEFAKEKFSEIREPRVVIETGIEGLMNSVEEQYYWDKLVLGDTMRVRQKRMNIDYKSRIIEMNIGLDDSDVEVKIANFTENVDNLDKFISILYSSESNSTILNNNKHKWDSVVEMRDQVTQLRDSEIDATKKRITAGVNESVEIGERGIVITTPSFPNEMIIMQAGVIALSEDGGETWKTSVTPNGVVAETVIGKLIAGNNLIITNDSGSIVMDGDGLEIESDSIKIMSGGENPKNLIDDWNNMIINMEDFANDGTVTPYEKSQISHQWNMISDSHSKIIESFIKNMGVETPENPYPHEYDDYLIAYENLKEYLFTINQSDGYTLLNPNRMDIASPIDIGTYRLLVRSFTSTKDNFILVMPMEYANAYMEVLESSISLNYVKNDEVVAKINLSEEGTRIDGKLLEINSRTEFNADLVMNAGLIQDANGDITIDLNKGEINLSKPLTINAKPVATKEDLDAIELQEGKSAYDIAKENGYTGTEAQWIESLKGKDGANGTAGTKGADGKTSYLHIAYATSANGSTGFSTTVSSGKKFIGQYTDFEEEDSENYTKYSWSKFKGENGYTPVKGTDYFDGKDGQDGSDGDSNFLWVRYSQNANGNPMTDSPTNAKYVGLATTNTSTAPTAYSDYKWSLVKGTDGINGEKGANGQTSYLHIKYSNDGGTTFTANNGESVGKWIGTYVDFTEADSILVSKYTWNKVAGEDGSDAKLLYLSTTAEVMTFNSDNTPNPATQTIAFTANMQNATGTATFTAIPYNGTTAMTAIALGGTGNIRTLTQAQFPATATRIEIKAVLGGLTDTVSVVKLKNGATGGTGATGSTGANGKNAIVGYLTNENVTFPANSSGVVTSANLVMANGVFKVFDGLTEKTGSGVTYSVVTQTGATGAITTAGAYSVSAISADNASITFRAIYSGATIDKVLTLSKSKEGVKGVTGSQGAKGADGISPIVGLLTNESITLPASSAGVVSSFTGATGTFNVYEGTVLRNASTSATYSVVSQSGITVSITQSGVYTVSAMTTGTSVLSGTATLRVVYGGVTVDKILAVTKALAGTQGATGATGGKGATGSAGQNATTYWINASTNAIKKDATGAIVPSTITFSGFSKTGTSNPVAYAGRFIIQTSTDGVSYANAYTSSANQASYTYTIPATASFVKARYYLAGGTSVLLDEQTIPVLVDAEGIEVGAKNLLLKSNEEITNSSYPITTYQMSEKMIVGQEYTLRLWGTLGTGKTNFTPYLNGGSISLGALKNNGDGTFSATFLGKDSGVTTGDILHIYPFASTTVVNSTITKIKLEKGNIATDWTEAPEDVEKAYKAVAKAQAELAETQAKAHADGKVTAEEKRAIADAKAKLKEAKKYVDDMEIGARNLLTGTSEEEREVLNGSWSMGSWNPGLTIGEEYTFSFDIKSENATSLRNVFLNSSNNGFVPNVPVTKEWTRIHFTFKWKGGSYSGNEFAPHIYARPSYSGTYVSRVKLEKGNKATDWTPAPEDIQAQIGSKVDNEVIDNLRNDLQDYAKTEDYQKEIGEVNSALETYKSLLETIERDLKGERDDNGEFVLDAEGNPINVGAIKEIEDIVNRETSITRNLGELAERWNFIGTNIIMASEGLLIGETGVDENGKEIVITGIRISKNRVDFVDNKIIVAHITGSQMKINRAIFVDSITVGEHKIETLSGGHTTWTWVPKV